MKFHTSGRDFLRGIRFGASCGGGDRWEQVSTSQKKRGGCGKRRGGEDFYCGQKATFGTERAALRTKFGSFLAQN